MLTVLFGGSCIRMVDNPFLQEVIVPSIVIGRPSPEVPCTLQFFHVCVLSFLVLTIIFHLQVQQLVHHALCCSIFYLCFPSFAFITTRLQYSLSPSNRLSDEHALIAAYVSRLQSGTRLVLGTRVGVGAWGVMNTLFPWTKWLKVL